MKLFSKFISIVIFLASLNLIGCVGTEQPTDPGSQKAKAEQPPTTPYDLTVKSFGDTIFNVSWKDSAFGATGYEIFRRKVSESYGSTPYIYADSGSFNVNDENVVRGISYFYKIRAFNNYGKSPFSLEVNTKGTGGSSSVAAPGGVQAKSNNPRVVKLTWVDNSSNENYFGIERRTDYSDFINIGMVSKNSAAFTDSGNGLVAGGGYYYRIKAYSSIDSSWSGEVYIQTPPYILKPPTITSIANVTSTSVQIKWRDNDTRYTVNQIYKRTEGESEFKYLDEVEDYLKSYIDENVVPSKTYYYKIISTDGTNISEFSDEASITTVIVDLLSPEFISHYYAGNNKIYLDWKCSQPAVKFVIERREVGANPPVVKLFEVAGSGRTYMDNVSACNKIFEYMIQASDKYSTSAFSGPVTVNGGCW